MYTMVNGGHKVTAKIVGEVFAPGNDVSVYMSPATLTALDPAAGGAGQYAISLKPGVNADGYASGLQRGARRRRTLVHANEAATRRCIAITTLVAMLTLLIIAVAGLGVLNTVALQIRERAHDIGVFKALGMTPRQTLTMVVCSVARHRPGRGHHRGPGRHRCCTTACSRRWPTRPTPASRRRSSRCSRCRR